jgi:hypothetical protein
MGGKGSGNHRRAKFNRSPIKSEIVGDKKCCTKCGEWKSFSEFSQDKHCANRLRPDCKQCRGRIQKEHRKKTGNWVHFSKVYGISKEMFMEILDNQNHNCPICHKRIFLNVRNKIHIDHDHNTGLVRGIVHSGCNTKIISAVENYGLGPIHRAIQYIELNNLVDDIVCRLIPGYKTYEGHHVIYGGQ